jgi:hypothetical protein
MDFKKRLIKNTIMKTSNFIKLIVILLLIVTVSCSKSDNDTTTPEPVIVSTINTASLGFKYKTYYQEASNATTRKGLIVLARGDGGSENDSTLNDQCNALAKLGYVATTTSYQTNVSSYFIQVQDFKNGMEEIILKLNTDFGIPANKTILGGLSLGGNMAYFMFLPPINGFTPTTLNLKGAVFMCSGADTYRGQKILKPAIVMCNKIDSQVGITNAYDFKTALQANVNQDVKSLSECLIFDNNNVDAHCSNSNEYQAFLIKKVKEWLP